MIKQIKGQEVYDEASVKLNRVIGTQTLDHADPFFLLDEFRSDTKEDYIAGFPMHRHRGIEKIYYLDYVNHRSKIKDGQTSPWSSLI